MNRMLILTALFVGCSRQIETVPYSTQVEQTTLSTENVYGLLKHSTVWIVPSHSSDGASGVVVGNQLIVTNAHVVQGQSEAFVFGIQHDLNNEVWDRESYLGNYEELHRKGVAAAARVIAYSSSKDLAVLWLDRSIHATRVLPLSDQTPKCGDPLYICGNPQGRPLFQFTYASASYVGPLAWTYPNGQYVNSQIISFVGTAWSGNSGGPVVDAKCNLVGVLTGAGKTHGTAISVQEVKALLDSIQWQRSPDLYDGSIADVR